MEKILIVDDNSTNRKSLKAILEDYQIIEATSGLEAIELAMYHVPTIILSDIVMPVMDGFELIQKLKSNDITKGIPFIFITNLTDVANEEKGLMLGAVDYIIKPYNPNIVKIRVKNHIDLYLYLKKYEGMVFFDGLTGILNRRGYEKYLKQDWNQACKNNACFSIILIDIDYFKRFNDNYGHLQGDDILRLVVQTIGETVKPYEHHFARYGGEEFVLIFSGLSLEEVINIAETIRENIENLKITHEYSKVSKVLTVSLGVVARNVEQNDTPEQFVDWADKNLYLAKAEGRNKVMFNNM